VLVVVGLGLVIIAAVVVLVVPSPQSILHTVSNPKDSAANVPALSRINTILNPLATTGATAALTTTGFLIKFNPGTDIC